MSDQGPFAGCKGGRHHSYEGAAARLPFDEASRIVRDGLKKGR